MEEGKDAFQQILRLYDIGRTAYSQNVIDSVVKLKSTRHFAPVASDNGTTFARGVRVEMELDEDQFVGGGAFLFASVIEHFLGLSASLNSFVSFSEVLAYASSKAGVLGLTRG